jgi:hypothetical protein
VDCKPSAALFLHGIADSAAATAVSRSRMNFRLIIKARRIAANIAKLPELLRRKT